MPSGRTHDRITLVSLPLVAGLTLLLSQDSSYTLALSGSFLFSGLMFGPDLDIYSCQFRRWGCLRWLWIPYQKAIRHRSFFSHGPVLGTTLRLIYLGCWLLLLGGFVVAIGTYIYKISWDGQQVMNVVELTWQRHWQIATCVWIGLELGAMSHSLSDRVGSALKKIHRR
jgi:uncharacterized metal-binding protein